MPAGVLDLCVVRCFETLPPNAPRHSFAKHVVLTQHLAPTPWHTHTHTGLPAETSTQTPTADVHLGNRTVILGRPPCTSPDRRMPATSHSWTGDPSESLRLPGLAQAPPEAHRAFCLPQKQSPSPQCHMGPRQEGRQWVMPQCPHGALAAPAFLAHCAPMLCPAAAISEPPVPFTPCPLASFLCRSTEWHVGPHQVPRTYQSRGHPIARQEGNEQRL